MKIIFLDSGPLGDLCLPINAPKYFGITNWANSQAAAGNRICIPEIVDYELRRELVRAGKVASVALLSALQDRFNYVPINTEAMLLAADLWARSRNLGLPTTNRDRIDVDVILAAQALVESSLFGVGSTQLTIATTNAKHLSQFVAADVWQNIAP